jgi:hypothetical protein
MTPEDIEEFALQNKLDVREMNPYQFRLLNENGKYILDIYFKRHKNSNRIIKNSTLQWKTNKWYFPKQINELKKLI